MQELRGQYALVSNVLDILEAALAPPSASSAPLDITNKFVSEVKTEFAKAWTLANAAAAAGRHLMALREHSKRHARAHIIVCKAHSAVAHFDLDI